MGSLSLDSLLNGQQLVHSVLDTLLEAVVLDTKLLLRLGRVQLEDLVIHVVSGLALGKSFLELRESLSDVVDNVLVVESLGNRLGKFEALPSTEQTTHSVADQESALDITGDGLVVGIRHFTDVSERRECREGNLLSARSVRLHERVDGTGRGVEGVQGRNGVNWRTEDHYQEKTD